MTDPSEAQLTNRLARGDARAFEGLYLLFNERVRLAAWQMCRRADWVDDVVNEAWRRAYEARAEFDQGRPFLVWVVGILRNCCREHARSRQRLSPNDNDPLHAIADTDPAKLAAQADLLAALDACIRALPLPDQVIVRKRFFEGKPLRVVAQEVGIAESTLRDGRLPDLYDRLRACLAARGLDISSVFSAQAGSETQWILGERADREP